MKIVFESKCSKMVFQKPSLNANVQTLKSISSNIKAYSLVVSICLVQLSRSHTITLTTLALYASALLQTILVLHALSSSSSLDVQIAAFGATIGMIRLFFMSSMFHELLHAVMIGVLTLLHGFEGSYFRSTFA